MNNAYTEWNNITSQLFDSYILKYELQEIIYTNNYVLYDADNIKIDSINNKFANVADICVIVPFFGRFQHVVNTCQSIIDAAAKTKLNIELVLIEKADTQEDLKAHNFFAYSRFNMMPKNLQFFCIQKVHANYKSKGLLMNLGALLRPNAKYYLVHDSDIIVQSSFFNKIQKNIERRGEVNFMQPYSNNRILLTTPMLAEMYFTNIISNDDLNEKMPGVFVNKNWYQKQYSYGGSVLISNKAYYGVGGFDDQIFWTWGAEDIMFWTKLIDKYGQPIYADYDINMFHIYHPPSINEQTSQGDFLNKMFTLSEKMWNMYQNIDLNSRLNYINKKSKFLSKYKNLDIDIKDAIFKFKKISSRRL